MADPTDESPGWNAIDAALRPIYGDREPYHVGTVMPYALGGPDPIHGISAYKNERPCPHWHFVTYGFSELWDKESADAEVSGYGFELTFRCACTPNAKKPPNWALNFLQNLGRYVFETGNAFGVGHTLPLNGPIEQGASTLIHAASFVHDPQLPPIDTLNGRVEFLQIVGLTMDELEAISSWNAAAFLQLRCRKDPLLVTDLSRTSWLTEPEFAAEVSKCSREDGSSCEGLSLVLDCDRTSDPVGVRVQSIVMAGLKRRLLSRLPYGRDFALNGKDDRVLFKPGTESKLYIGERELTITLREDHAVQFAQSLEAHAGVYPIAGLKNVVLQALTTEIKDQDGTVVEIVE